MITSNMINSTRESLHQFFTNVQDISHSIPQVQELRVARERPAPEILAPDQHGNSKQLEERR
jgi:exonuclease III